MLVPLFSFRAVLRLTVGVLLAFALSASGQNPTSIQPITTDGTPGPQRLIDLLLWPPSARRNPLQADPSTMVAFVRPWLVSSRLFDLSNSATAHTRTKQPKSYRLTPDPFNWSLANTSPDEDDYAYSPDLPRIGFRTTAERIAETNSAPHRPSSIPAKFDVSRIGERDIGEGINFFSLEKEVAIGRELSMEVEQSARLLTDPAVNEYVNRTGQILVRHSDCKVPFTIKVIDDDEVNAFALPGGFFYINTGAILAADDEAELAGVMAHEIAHVCARHATRNLTKSEITQYASLPLIFFGGPVGYAVRQAASVAMPMSFLKFSRDAEREADLLGIEYQYAAGYDPTAFVDFFEKLEGEDKEPHSFIARAFMTHPMTQDRVRRAEAELEMLPDRESYITDTSEFDAIRDRVSRLTHGRALQGGPRPHPTLRRRTGAQE
jgi:peptidase M48-like protein